MMRPNPPHGVGRRCLRKLPSDVGLRQRTVPPGAGGEPGVADVEAVPVAGNPELPQLIDPAGNLLPSRAALVQIVIAGADHQVGPLPHELEISPHDETLRPEVDMGADLAIIAGE